MAVTFHGRIYLKNLPKTWCEEDLEKWIVSLHLPAPSGSKMFKKPHADLASAFVHWKQVTQGQLDTFVEHLREQWLTFKQVHAEVSPATVDRVEPPATVDRVEPNNVEPPAEQNVEPPAEAPWRAHRKRTFAKATWLKNGEATHRFLQGKGKKHSPIPWVSHEQWHNGGSKMSLLSRST